MKKDKGTFLLVIWLIAAILAPCTVCAQELAKNQNLKLGLPVRCKESIVVMFSRNNWDDNSGGASNKRFFSPVTAIAHRVRRHVGSDSASLQTLHPQ